MRKVLCIILALVLMCSLMTISAGAYSNNMFEYVTLFDNTVRITAYHGYYAHVTIPRELSTDWGVLPVTSIGEGAFENCTYLESVIIPDTVQSIGTDAFRGCTNLEDVTVPDSVTEIGCWAFADTNLQNLREDDSFIYIGKVAYQYKGDFNYADIRFADGTLGIGGGIFYVSRLAGPRSVFIPDSVKTIGDWAFRGCTYLENVQIGSGVEKIGEQAFFACYRLKSLILPPSAKYISYDAFESCSALTLSSTSELVHNYANWYEIPFVPLPCDYLLGDADGNGDVDICDATVIGRQLAQLPTDAYVEAAADADRDGTVTIYDANRVQLYLAELSSGGKVGIDTVTVNAANPDLPYTTVDFGRFTADVPKNWVYEKENDRFCFYEAYNHEHEETGSNGYLCAIYSVTADAVGMVPPFAHYLGGDGYNETYLEYPTGMGIIQDKTGSQKMQAAMKQTNAFEASVIVK